MGRYEGYQMAQKNSMPIESFESLCTFDGEKYVAKEGQAYIDALSVLYPPKNANDRPFTLEEIKRQPLLTDFNFSGLSEFKYVCNLTASPLIISEGLRSNEKILAIDFQNSEAKRLYDQTLGVVYILTCVINDNEHIVKIGCSRTTFKQRLGSYNCGTVNNWRTASTTNIKILQSFQSTRAIFKLYLYDCGAAEKFTWHGVESVPFSSQKIYAVEDILVKKFQEIFHQKPLANVQTSATEA